MAITYTWSVPTVERNMSDGGITTIHIRCQGSETVGSGDDAVTYTASFYATTSHIYDAAASDFVTYDNVTEAQAIAWSQAELDQDAIEANIAANIAEQKTPTTGAGVPW